VCESPISIGSLLNKFDELKWFEQQPSEAEAQLISVTYGTAKAVPFKTTKFSASCEVVP
jgi:hypothetical protein